jgi:CubicO group peptidase (beta-lactamase class C family)
LAKAENADSVFEIGSISKVFTSILLAHAVLEKKVKLDDPVAVHLPYPLKDDAPFTLRQLANHTSGLPRLPSNLLTPDTDQSNPYKDYGGEELREYLTDELTLESEPGSVFAYSNLGAGLLGYILAGIEGKSYRGLLQEKIFDKYEMENSSATKEDLSHLLVEGLDADGKVVSNWDFQALAGAGAILSNAKDMVRFVLAQFEEDPALALARQKTFEMRENLHMGLGWHIITTESGNVLYFHNGGTGGYRSAVAINLDKKTGVVILTNVSAFNAKSGHIDNLCFELTGTLLNK